jgi:hypothetical protein
MPTSDRLPVRSNRSRGDHRLQELPGDVIGDAADRVRKGARKQGEEQFVSYCSVPAGPNRVVACAPVVVRDAGDRTSVVRRPEVAVQDDVPSVLTRAASDSFHDRSGLRVGIVVERKEHRPAKAGADVWREVTGWAQYRDRRMRKSLAWNPDGASFTPMRVIRPVGSGPELSQTVEADCFNPESRPGPISILDPPAEGTIRCGRVVTRTTDPSIVAKVGADNPSELGTTDKSLGVDRSIRFDPAEVTTLREQQGKRCSAAEPCRNLVGRGADLTQPVLPIPSAIEVLRTAQGDPYEEAVVEVSE